MSLSIGITCYATFGGSGIVATEVGLAMARRGHKVHFIGAELPGRLTLPTDNVRFHAVRALEYPLFPQTPYSLALASRIVEVARTEGLDLVHAHYAVPHATSAWMAREVLGGALPVVTTLHGTDITLVGTDPSYLPITRHSVIQSDAVTAPSEYLRRETWTRLDLDPHAVPIEVIPNFVDTESYRPRLPGEQRLVELFGPRGAELPVLVHVSNFRPLKRLDRVVEIFARVADRALLLLVGDGPEREPTERLLEQRGLRDRVRLVGEQEHVAPLVRECAVFLLPSTTESFGLAALEALSSGVPVVASGVGGLPEVVRHGETGFLVPPDDVDGMAAAVALLLDDPDRRRLMGQTARADAVARFQLDGLIDRYAALYARLTGDRPEAPAAPGG